MKKLQSFLCLLGVLFWCVIPHVSAQPSPTNQFFINDFANVLSPETENFIFTNSKAYFESDKTQVVVTTVESLDGKDIERYALEMARNWGIGDKEQDNGILILLAVSDRQIRIEVGTGMEGIITDTKSGRFIRNATDFLSAGDFDSGIKSIYTAIIDELENPTPDSGEEDVSWLELLLILILIFGLSFFWGGRFGRRRFFGGGYYGGFGHFGGFGHGGGGGFGGSGFSGGGGGFSGGGASGRF